jgi:prepilin peptidase CpaA
MNHSVWLPITVTLIASLAGAVTDVWKFRVYNVLTFPLLASGLIYHTWFDGWSGLTTSSWGVFFGFMALIVPYAMGVMGAGDVKLLAGIGAWLGFPVTLVVFVISTLVTGVYATILIAYRGKPRESLATMKVVFYRFAVFGSYFGKDDLVEEIAIQKDRRLRMIPFGAMIPTGIIGAIIWLAWLR